MVKVFLFLFFCTSFLFSQESYMSVPLGETSEESREELLGLKIETFIDKKLYQQNKAYIDILFSPSSDYFYGQRIDSVKVIHTLKENGLLNLFFKKPTNLKLNFKTSGSPLFFVKIMGNSLRNIGYYRYVTAESNLNSREFTWSINLTSEYATDPFILQNELKKSGCEIVDIQKNSSADWTYTVDMRNGHLDVDVLEKGRIVKLKRSLYAHWLDISSVTKLQINSSRRDNWYPKISYYNNSLHLLKVIHKDTKRTKLILDIPKNAKYIKISDIYTLKNVKDDLVLIPRGSK